MSLSTELQALSDWWHGFIDHLFKHPQADTVAHPAIAAVAAAAQPVVKPSQDPVRSIDPFTGKLAGYTGPTDNLAPLPETKPVDITFESGELSWGSLDGHQAIRNFKAGQPVIASYNFEGPFVATFAEVPGSNAVPTAASFNGAPVPVSQSGSGGGEVKGIVGPCQIAFTAQSDTRWSVGCKPA